MIFHWRILLAFSWLLVQSLGLNTDGTLLLSFKTSVLSDPLGVLDSWNNQDQTPCSWNGVTCGTPGMGNAYFRVIGLSLPDSQLLASIPPNLGSMQYLRTLDLSNNSINGSLPFSLFNAVELQMLDLSNNLISGELPELVGGLTNLELLNISDNAFVGKIPENLTTLANLTVVSLNNNYFSGSLPSGFRSVEILDLSSNLINGSLPSNFVGNNLHYLNVSYNRLAGEIPSGFSNQIPANATIDLSFNNFTGEIPQTILFLNQQPGSFSGNPELCGEPLKNACPIPSSISSPPNAAAPTTATPAIAGIPKTIESAPATNPAGTANGSTGNGLRTGTIVGIVVGDVLGVSVLALIFLTVCRLKKKWSRIIDAKSAKSIEVEECGTSPSSAVESKGIISPLACFRKRANDSEEEEESSETAGSVGGEVEGEEKGQEEGTLVTVDGGEELELETLLKASAYILGATGSSIVYKAVLDGGTAVAVRRIGGESGGLVERFRDFESKVRAIAKLVHPNLVRIRGFYSGPDDKLVIYEFVPNGSLANARHRKVGSSPCTLPWVVRLKIARGVARGLTYIHEKKQVHGNLKPSNILLSLDMEPKIGDLGLGTLVSGESGYRTDIGSAQNFGSHRSTASRDSFSFQDAAMGATPSRSPSSVGSVSPYYAPESFRSLKPSPKSDVFSFGIVLLELLTGRGMVHGEFPLGPEVLPGDEKSRVLRMADAAIRADLEGKEDALLALFRLGGCCTSPVPQKRPSMKEVLQALEKFPSFSPSSTSSS